MLYLRLLFDRDSLLITNIWILFHILSFDYGKSFVSQPLLQKCFVLFGLQNRFPDAGVAFAKSGGKWGLVNSDGWIVAPEFDEYKEFEKGVAKVKINSKWKFITRDGKPKNKI